MGQLHTACFSLWAFLFLHALQTHSCPVSVFTDHSHSKSHCPRIFKFHYLCPVQTSGVSSSAFSILEVLFHLTFAVHLKLFQELIHHLFSTTRAFSPTPCSVSQLYTACYSTSPEIQSFYLTRPIIFLRWTHHILHWDHLYFLLSPSFHTESSVFYCILLMWLLPNTEQRH